MFSESNPVQGVRGLLVRIALPMGFFRTCPRQRKAPCRGLLAELRGAPSSPLFVFNNFSGNSVVGRSRCLQKGVSWSSVFDSAPVPPMEAHHQWNSPLAVSSSFCFNMFSGNPVAGGSLRTANAGLLYILLRHAPPHVTFCLSEVWPNRYEGTRVGYFHARHPRTLTLAGADFLSTIHTRLGFVKNKMRLISGPDRHATLG